MAAVRRTERDGASGRRRRVTRFGRASLTGAAESHVPRLGLDDELDDEPAPPDDGFSAPVWTQ
jgi:hypothetical protein